MKQNGLVMMGGGAQFSGLFAPAGTPKTCVPSPDGLAFDRLAAMFGCPDCPGMTEIAGTGKYTFCYWIRRPMGQIALAGAIALVVYFVMKGE